MNQRLLIGLSAGMLTVLGTTGFSYAQPVVDTGSEGSPEIIGNSQQAQQAEVGSDELNLDKGRRKTRLRHRRYNYSSSNTGLASWYDGHNYNDPTSGGPLAANGEYLNRSSMTAAHRTLPFGTRVLVTNLNNNRSVVVRINDRGPFIPGRSLDLHIGPARVLGVTNSGVAPVRMQILGR